MRDGRSGCLVFWENHSIMSVRNTTDNADVAMSISGMLGVELDSDLALSEATC